MCKRRVGRAAVSVDCSSEAVEEAICGTARHDLYFCEGAPMGVSHVTWEEDRLGAYPPFSEIRMRIRIEGRMGLRIFTTDCAGLLIDETWWEGCWWRRRWFSGTGRTTAERMSAADRVPNERAPLEI